MGFLFSLFFFLCSFFANAQVTSSIDSTKIKIGEQILYTIKVQADTTDVVVFPEEQTFLPLEMIESYKTDTTFEASKYRFIKKYGLTQFDSGRYTIPPQRIIINNKPFFTDSINVEVNDVVVDTTKQKMYDIKAAIEVKNPPFDWLLLLYWLLPIILILGLVFYFFRRKKRKEAAERQLPPYEEAIVALKKLDNTQLLKENKSKEYYSNLTEIVKRYLDREVDESALESTSDELITRLMMHKDAGNFDFDKETIRKLDQIFKRADLVKFAKMNQLSGQAEVDRKTIEEIINETHEAVPEPTEEELLKNQEYLELQQKKRRRKRIIIGIVGGFFVLAITTAILIATLGYSFLKENIIGHPTKELAEGRWIRSEYGYPAVIIETPKVLVRKEMEIPEQLSGTILSMNQFQYGSMVGQFIVTVNTVIYGQSVTIDMNAGLESFLSGMEQMGATNMVVKQEPFSTEKGIEGIRAFGEFDAKLPNGKTMNQKLNYELLAFKQEAALQGVLVVYLKDDKYAEEIKERIINSIEIEITEQNAQ
ncbi:DUF4381 family protein [Aequorivita echinoideorum]|uniref:DUF4381 domain-containing protein n=1 Tax=Aequorivita echinoideorum TaxID=1549647 RepID=A0ABS5S3S4_9FLAO|nr:DUF4381 family protein [Aequorivita echinoideorum]MBT0607079.1 DUF4381 domain-containing protein [Aequorivita echinoideorum]